MITNAEYPDLLFFSTLSAVKEIAHFSTTRNGGVSTGEFESLNLGNYSDDNSLSIFENRNRLAHILNTTYESLITPHQTHGSNVILIDNAFLKSSNSEKNEKLYGFDASITKETDLFLCVTTADCVPILLYDTQNHASGAIHAGWRGTAQLIVPKTLAAMQKYFGTDPKNIMAAIGPSISMDKYEVGEEVVEELQKSGHKLSESNMFRNPKTQKPHIDLKEINRQSLIELGIPENQIEKTSYCTYSEKNLFFSARRQSVHSGRMLTGIMLKRKQ